MHMSLLMIPVLLIYVVALGMGFYIAYLLIKALKIYIKKNQD